MMVRRCPNCDTQMAWNYVTNIAQCPNCNYKNNKIPKTWVVGRKPRIKRRTKNE